VTSLKKSQVAAENVAALLEEANDPLQTPERLRVIWHSTKSVRVRKAIASNPNSDSKTMAMAARLYIREVIGNPSFEILNLFAEDKIVKTLYDAYMEPSKIGSIMSIRKAVDRTNVARAVMVSPRLSSYQNLHDICSVLSSVEFSRELKDPDVNKRVQGVAKRGIGFYQLPTLLFLHSNGVLSDTDLGRAFNRMDTAESRTTRGAYVSTVFEYVGKAANDPQYKQILLDFVRINKAHQVRDLIKTIKKKPETLSDTNLSMFNWLFRELLRGDVECKRRQYREARQRYGYGSYQSLGDGCHSYHLSDLIWVMVSLRNGCGEKSITDIDLVKMFDDIKRVGFDSDYGPYSCELKFAEMKFLTGRNNMCRKLIELKDDRAFLFYTTCGLMWPEWYAKGDISNPEYQVVQRLHRINEKRFANGEPALYTYSNLDDFPCVRVAQSHGLEYNKEDYYTNKE